MCLIIYNIGEGLPRLLPCGGILCEKCIEELLDGESIDCPDCGSEHPASSGVQSFPVPENNRTVNRKKSNSPAATSLPRHDEDRCREHGKHPSIYCKEPYCTKTIRYLQANQGVIDVDAEDKEIETLFANLGTATENLKFYKTKILAAIERVEQENTHCLDNMKTKKDELAKKFSNNKEVVTILSHKFFELLKSAHDYISEVNAKIDAELTAIDKHFKTLDGIRDRANKSASTFEDITGWLGTIKSIETELKDSLSNGTFQYCEYVQNQDIDEIVKRLSNHLLVQQSSIADDVESLCGSVTQKETSVNSSDSITVTVKKEPKDREEIVIDDDSVVEPGTSTGTPGQKRPADYIPPLSFFEGKGQFTPNESESESEKIK